jgi:acyl transferase domain-containing protein/acyl carrier protein
MDSTKDYREGIAIIGMTGRFPGAKNTAEFWQNLCDGMEAISFFSDDELIASGIPPELLGNPNYVKASAVLEDIDLFDASFFGLNPKEAEITDPQHRLFLECAWEALEKAGYDSQRCESRIGVFAGASLNNYLPFDVNNEQIGSASSFQKLIGNDKDFLSTRVSYKLNLSGPSLTVQTACSTSLVAISLACQSVLNYQCDMALAGGVSIRVPQKTGYLHQEGGILSPDGHCRAFDANAQGTIIGNGVGVLVLKRLTDAIADGDHIHAVIKAGAINNDGSHKVGYTAPSVNGQAEVIAEALALADVEPESISYIEAHGTGTSLGDPIEVTALTNVYRTSTDKTGFCAIGSVKTNIGHLDAAAGVTGVIKTVLALQHKLIPPSLNFEQPNPQIDFANSPFYINTKLTEWQAGTTPRRAGVSSLGIGGTNAHVILEEAPVKPASSPSRPWQLLLLSAKTDTALDSATQNLAQHLTQHPQENLADVAYTLQVGRKEFNHRRILVCKDTEDAASTLNKQDGQRVLTHLLEPLERSIVFMFPGQGTQYVEMGKELYQTEPIFREQVDNCCEILKPYLGLDLRSLFYPSENEAEIAAEKLKQTSITQPALFVIEYALAQLWMSWGISPDAMIGHSIGEYVAACLAGVMSPEDALALVAIRGRLMQELPSGAMLSVSLNEEEVKTLLKEELSLAANNAPNLCVISGNHSAVNALEKQLNAEGVQCRRLHTSHAFHSQMMESILEPFIGEVKKVKLYSPKIPFVSNVTGTWITPEEATNPHYWARHLRQTVRFSEGLSELLQEPNRILLEVGAGRTLCTLVKQHSHQAAGQVVLPSLRHLLDEQSDVAFILNILGRLWLAGVTVNWSAFYTHEQRHRVPLPTYPFERQRYWIERQKKVDANSSTESKLGKKPNIIDWFYVPSWKRVPLVKAGDITIGCSLIFVDECGVGSQIIERLKQAGQDVFAVLIGEKFTQGDNKVYTINPANPDDYNTLLYTLKQQGKTPNTVINLWSLTNSTDHSLETIENCGFWSLIYLLQAFGQQNITASAKFFVISNHLYDVTGHEELLPVKATILGACKVIPQEYPSIQCRHIDVVVPESGIESLVNQLITELTSESDEPIIAYRENHRWVQVFEPIALEKPANNKTRLRQEGVYLITGGMGGIGLELAKYLAQTVKAKLILVGRSQLPAKEQWERWIASHDASHITSRKIQKVRELEKLGAEVLVLSADVANYEEMQQVVSESLEHFGEINGVIHAAGVAGSGMIQLKTPEIVNSVFAPKVQGTLVIDQVFKDTNLDFLVLCSSLSAIQGGLGQVDYCAANAFLDNFAHFNTSKNGKLTLAINWDTWQEVGMAVNTVIPDELKDWREETLKNGILPTEAVDAFSRILGNSIPQILVSTQELQAVIEQSNQLLSSYALKPKLGTDTQLSNTRHLRTIQDNTYIAPRNQIEENIANIWQELIGIDRVGIDDNFFELGGHSLLAVQTISRLRELFQVDLPLRTLLFEAPTVAKLAIVITEKQSKTEELEEIEQLLAEVENLSMDEVQQQLLTAKYSTSVPS